MSRRPQSLVRRTVMAAVAGAITVAAVGAALAIPLLRGVAEEQARLELVRTVESLASSPRVTARLVGREQRIIGPDDRRYALVRANGRPTGQASEFLTSADVETLKQRGSLSTSNQMNGTDFLVEGRAVRGGLLNRGVAIVAAQPMADPGSATRALIRRLAIALLAGLCGASVLAVLLAQRMAAPVRAASGRAHRLAAGERGLPAPAPSSIAEIDEMTEALTALDSALVGSEGRQREFLLSISHDLRTPLTALRGYAEALKDGAIAPEEVAGVGATLSAETERLDRFIADLLELARLEADDFRVQVDDLDVAAFARTVVQAWQGTARRVSVRLVGRAADSPITLSTDPARLRQIVDGLVENALRATPTGGMVNVRAVMTSASIDIEVVDSGPGLAPGDHEHAFDRGYLRDRYASERPVGTGLGLSIAHRLSGRLGAELTALPSVDGGTTMRLRFQQGFTQGSASG